MVATLRQSLNCLTVRDFRAKEKGRDSANSDPPFTNDLESVHLLRERVRTGGEARCAFKGSGELVDSLVDERVAQGGDAIDERDGSDRRAAVHEYDIPCR